MKCISLWQPFAALIVHNEKFIETRSWPASKSLIGQRIGIASTKTINPFQRLMTRDPEFKVYYARTGLPPLEELPNGYLLGTVLLKSCEVMDYDSIADITAEERCFGVYEPGRYFWRLREPIAFQHPTPVRGRRRIWD